MAPGVRTTPGPVTVVDQGPATDARDDQSRRRRGQHDRDHGRLRRLTDLWSDRPGRLVTALVAGVLLFLAFPPVGWWWVAAPAIALLTVAVHGVRPWAAYRLGLLFSLAFLLPLLAWSRVAGLDAWVLLTITQTLLAALAGPLLAVTARGRLAPLWVASSWTLVESVRSSVPFGGFPWGRLAFSQGHGTFLGLAAVGGAPLVGFAVALTGGLLAQAVLLTGDARLPARVRAGLLVAVLAVPVALVGAAVPTPTAAQDGTAVVAAVQGNVPRRGLDALGQKRAVTINHVLRTEQLATDAAAGRVLRPDLVLWPENSSDVDPFVDVYAGDLLAQASAAVGRPLLVGAVLQGPGAGHVRNAGLVWTPQGWSGQIYVKQHPVPFAEYLPGRPVLQKIVHRFKDLMPNDFVAGHHAGVIDLPTRLGARAPTVRIDDVICFEVAYDGLVRTPVQRGARLIVVQTNNATFGASGETYQQLEMSRLRAVEHGRAVVVVSTSGVSALIAPDGSVLTTAAPFTSAALVRAMPLRSSLTIADRLGGSVELVLVGIGVLGLLLAAGTPLHARLRARPRATAPLPVRDKES